MANGLNTRTLGTPLPGKDAAASEPRQVCPHCNSSLTAGEEKVSPHLAGGMKAIKYWIHRQIHKLLLPVLHRKTAINMPRVNQIPMGSFGDFSFEDMAQITLDAIGDAVLVVDPNSKIIYLNKVAESLTGWSKKKALGRPLEEVFFIIDGTTRLRAMSPAQQAISEGRIVELALGSILIRRDGTDMAIEDSAAPIHNSLGKIAGAVIVFHDARQSESVQQEAIHLAQHDFLTGLPNRALLVERLTQAIGMADRHHSGSALLFIDLDNFKQINDNLGHTVGDHLLRNIAADIIDCVRSTDTVSRHGGDEFIILLSEIKKRQDAARIAEKLLARFAVSRVIDGHELQVTLSIGISIYSEDGIDAETLILNADAAMYDAKDAGRNTYRFCSRFYENNTCSS